MGRKSQRRRKQRRKAAKLAQERAQWVSEWNQNEVKRAMDKELDAILAKTPTSPNTLLQKSSKQESTEMKERSKRSKAEREILVVGPDGKVRKEYMKDRTETEQSEQKLLTSTTQPPGKTLSHTESMPQREKMAVWSTLLLDIVKKAVKEEEKKEKTFWKEWNSAIKRENKQPLSKEGFKFWMEHEEDAYEMINTNKTREDFDFLFGPGAYDEFWQYYTYAAR